MDRHSANVVRYAIPLIFGDRPHPKDPVHQNGATGVVVDAGEGAFLITAAHRGGTQTSERTTLSLHGRSC